MLPLTIVVFGATGDLFQKKLARAFFDCAKSGIIPEKFTLIGLSRKLLSHVEFRDLVKSSVGLDIDQNFLESFLQKVCYYSLDATDLFAVEGLREILDNVDQGHGACSNKLFYIATAPDTYEDIFGNISKSGLGVPCVGNFQNQKAWIRIIVEKPFGTDAENAKKLDELLGESFEEEQIFRIDHYLAKETVQNIYSFRFKNILFAPLWSRKYIDKVEIYSFETALVPDNRKNFYDRVGALRDFGQNHLLELVSLIAMEDPDSAEAKDIRRKRGEALADTHFDYEKKDDLVLGQYEGYADGEFKDSKTETYFRARLSVDNERWKNVPFIIEHGKVLSEIRAGISVYFKKTKAENQPNVIHFKIQPDSQICVEMSTISSDKNEQKMMCFDLGGKENQFIYPYERLLQDALEGDQTLFVSTEEVKEEWRITEEIQEAFSQVLLKIYKKNSSKI